MLFPSTLPSSLRKSDPSIDVSARVAAAAAAAMAALPALDAGRVAREAAPAPAEAKPPPAAEAKDDEIPISADAFDELGQTPTTPPAPEGEPKKRPSKAPRGTKAG
jgi:outer membrane biosynthesis protein TonB